MTRMISKVFVVVALTALIATPAMAQLKFAVIDVQRVVADSDPGKEALGVLKQLQDAKIAEGQALQQELETLRDQFNKQRFTLADDKLEGLQKQIQDKGISLERFQDDAQRDIDGARRRALDGLEARIMPIIDEIGKDQQITMIFNKFQSGLVYADEAVDITDEVIRRFNTLQ